MKKYSVEQGFMCWDDKKAFAVSPIPATYYMEVEGEEYTFLIRPTPRKDSVMLTGAPEDEYKLIMYIGPPFKGLIRWIISRYMETYEIIPDIFTLQSLFKQAGMSVDTL